MIISPNSQEQQKVKVKRITGGRLRIGTLASFTILLDWSLLFLIILFLIPGESDRLNKPYLLIALPSVFVHEAAHALVSRLFGFGKGSITIWMWGAYFIPYDLDRTPFEMENWQKKQYILMVLAGPVSNICLAALAFVSFLIFRQPILESIAIINMGLAILNLMPLPPFDGSQALVTYTSEWFARTSVYIIVFWIVLALACCGGIVFSIWTKFTPALYFLAIAIPGLIATVRYLIKSDADIISEWQKGMEAERIAIEGEGYPNGNSN